MPAWLHALAVASLVAAAASSTIIVSDLLAGRKQRMWITDIVWPVTALWSGPLGLWAYFRWGRAAPGPSTGQKPHPSQPFPVTVAKAATHCGSGCTLADALAEGVVAAIVPLTLFGHRLFGGWVYDLVAAYLLGIVFQYFTIAPMRGLSLKDGLVAAIKADTLSLAAWQVGMFGWMALVRFALIGRELPKGSPTFWFMMQLAMFLGFATSYPVNWWLLRKGVKERM